MPSKPLILDFSEFDPNTVIADIEEIRRYNPQRYEMEHLTAICYQDLERHIMVGYKDLGPNEFWIRGHMPGVPIMPGVIMCESAAQLASYYCRKNQLIEGMVGFGGLQEVRFRGLVRPGDRFLIVAKLLKLRRQIMTSQFQCFVEQNLVCDGVLKGIRLPIDEPAGEES